MECDLWFVKKEMEMSKKFSTTFTRTMAVLTMSLLSSSAYAVGEAPLRVCADPGNMPLSNTRGEGFQNKIASVLAEAMGTQATFFYRPYLERGLTRQTFDNNECDILMDMSADDERMLSSTPIYRSTFVLAYRNDKGIDIKSLDDAKLLNDYKVGVFQHSAIRQVLQERGINRNNTIVRTISHDADLKPERQPSQDVQQVIDGKLDVAAIWGPMAGWYKTAKNAPLTILPLNRLEDQIPMEFDLGIGIRKNGKALKVELEKALITKKAEIKQILQDYGVPLVQCETCIVSGDIPTHGIYKPHERVLATSLVVEEPALEQIKAEVAASLTSGLSLGEQLYNAVLANQPNRLAYLIASKADVNFRDTQKQTPLMMAVQNQHEALVATLLKHGADVNVVDVDGWTAAMHAAMKNEPKMLRTMSAYRPKYEVVNSSGFTALAIAAQQGKTLAAIALLDGGAKVDFAVGDSKFTPLLIAAKAGYLPMAQALLQYGANVNKRNTEGYSALMLAAAKNKADVVSLLIKSGANQSFKDKQGKTAIQLAEESKATAAIKMLETLASASASS